MLTQVESEGGEGRASPQIQGYHRLRKEDSLQDNNSGYFKKNLWLL
jgi:hypothetical protein